MSPLRLGVFVLGLFTFAGLTGIPAQELRPRLLVIVSVDQLAYEYLERFYEGFAPDGFFRQCEANGGWYSNCHHRHALTYTAPGHAVQSTGTYPNRHGIIDNDWYDRARGELVYCVSDPDSQIIGTTSSEKPVSPKALACDTVGDRLKLAYPGAKVFGVGIKDRAAILLAGHLADAAYWLSYDGKWITSSYYRSDIPGYLRALSEQGVVEQYAGRTWDLLLDPSRYRSPLPEDSFGERPVFGMSADFPHRLPAADDKNFIRQLAASPFGNEQALQAARELIVHEQLGQDDLPDLLGINLSSNDYVGHAFGPHSLEVEDLTYRTDRQLAEFAAFVDQQLEGRPWTLLLTADHGVAPIPEVAQRRGLKSLRNPLGRSDSKTGNIETLRQPLEAYLRRHLPGGAGRSGAEKNIVEVVTDSQVYLQADHPALETGRVRAEQLTRDWLLQHEAIAVALTRSTLLESPPATPLEASFARTWHAQRSGDVLFALAPYCQQGEAATTHGSPWQYDSHVPLLVRSHPPALQSARRVARPVSPAAIAPTIAALAGVTPPSACVEEPLREVLR